MMRFEKVSKYANDPEIKIPSRSTTYSAGYDFASAQDIVIPPFEDLYDDLESEYYFKIRNSKKEFSLKDIAHLTKILGTKPTLIPTGIKAELPNNKFLQLSARSSMPLKHWLIMANGVGIIDADYYNNPDNEGEIFFQYINLSPIPIKINKGDIIGQGIILDYYITEDDAAGGKRVGGFGSTDENSGS